MKYRGGIRVQQRLILISRARPAGDTSMSPRVSEIDYACFPHRVSIIVHACGPPRVSAIDYACYPIVPLSPMRSYPSVLPCY